MAANRKEIMPYIIGMIASSVLLGIGKDLNLSVLQIPSGMFIVICFVVILGKTDS